MMNLSVKYNIPGEPLILQGNSKRIKWCFFEKLLPEETACNISGRGGAVMGAGKSVAREGEEREAALSLLMEGLSLALELLIELLVIIFPRKDNEDLFLP